MNEDILIVDEGSLRDKIYVVRGVQVMLDFDLAEIYGYETKNFNRQIKNNIERFEGDDFMFRLTKAEYENLRCKNFTSSWGGMRYLPNAFTEQGVYLLMTVLKGELAVKQSRALIRLFKKMKDYYVGSPLFMGQDGYFFLSEKLEKHSKEITNIKEKMVCREELSGFMEIFDVSRKEDEVLILDGEPFKADVAYQRIYGKAKKSVIMVDDYIGVKTLRHFVHAPVNVTFTVVSDNKGGSPMRLTEFNDFKAEYPGRSVTFLQSMGRVHDRYIVIDYGARSMKVFHCGASSKDAGKKITTITRIKDVKEYKALVKELMGNPVLLLK